MKFKGHEIEIGSINIIIGENINAKTLGFMPDFDKTYNLPESEKHPREIERFLLYVFDNASDTNRVAIRTHCQYLMLYADLLAQQRKINTRFIGIVDNEDGGFSVEQGDKLANLATNTALDFHLALYDKQQEFIFDKWSEDDNDKTTTN